jgi:hypothetical protein
MGVARSRKKGAMWNKLIDNAPSEFMFDAYNHLILEPPNALPRETKQPDVFHNASFLARYHR